MSREELVEELTQARTRLQITGSVKRADSITPIVLKAIPYTALCVIAYFLFRTVESLSGETTLALFNVQMLLNSNFLPALIGAFLGGGGVIYGLGQRRLKQKVIEKLQPRIQRYEKQVDPGRTSSQLTAAGNTNPADE